MKAKAIAVFGTASDVGKSLIATAICRLLTGLGICTAPFKAQNMSNNSYVTIDGGEIGRAQALQAFACKREPTVDMNPVLLKPTDNLTSQVVVLGKPIGNRNAKTYFKNTEIFFEIARESLDRLMKENDAVVIEGAGSCAEVNLRNVDFVNFKVALHASADVILVADIDKGGVFAQILGTIACLTDKEKSMIKGIIINKFRGDIGLLKDGIEFIEKTTNIPVLGVLPFFDNILLDYEDSLPETYKRNTGASNAAINLGIIALRHMSNFTDFMPFSIEPDVDLTYLFKPQRLDGFDAILLPGTKNAIDDMLYLRNSGWEHYIKNYAKKGGTVFGICGGYQLLGRKIHDPWHVESNMGYIEALGLLKANTILMKTKRIYRSSGIFTSQQIPVNGYEIHVGNTFALEAPAINIRKRNRRQRNILDGAISKKITGTYLHGIFDGYRFRHHFLTHISAKQSLKLNKVNFSDFRDTQINRLLDLFIRHVDIEKFLKAVFPT